jgi:diguanylate cyclase (GGDEF)-like protein/PAS domain S-box-containing protein
MDRFLCCLLEMHDLRFVLAAAVICCVSAGTTVALLRQIQTRRHMTATQVNDRAYWARRALLGAAAVSGFGIWATHFIAMMGYDPGVPVRYDVPLTLLSVTVVVVLATAGFALVTSGTSGKAGLLRLTCGAVLIGLGISCMHYLGMAALLAPGKMQWERSFVVASVALSILPMVPALALTLRRHGRASAVAAAALMTLAVVLLHFVAMAGLDIQPVAGVTPTTGRTDMPPEALAAIVACVTLGLLAMAAITLIANRRADQAIESGHREFRAMINAITDCAIYLIDPRGRILSWNAGATRMFGYTPDDIIGHHASRLQAPPIWPEADPASGGATDGLAVAANTSSCSAVSLRLRADGSTFWGDSTLEPIQGTDARIAAFACVVRDVSVARENRLHLDAALEHMHHGLVVFDGEGRTRLVNRQFRELWHLPDQERVIATHYRDLADICLRSAHCEATGMRADTLFSQDYAVSHHTAARTVELHDDRVISITGRPMPGGGWVLTLEDISDRRRAEARLSHMALHDSLTGLPNRSSFISGLTKALGNSDDRVAVIVIDLDRFKDLNDSQGHQIGDVAARLRDAMPPQGSVARFGGDEFAAYLPFRSMDELHAALARLTACFSAAFSLGDLACIVDASIGVSISPTDHTQPTPLTAYADLAMYRAKAKFGTGVCFYESSMNAAARRRNVIAAGLRQALASNEFSLVYQVLTDLPSGQPIGYEALLRWEHPTEGHVSPAEFIPIAESTGDILGIGEWVLREACTTAAGWPEPYRIAVNLSGVQIYQPAIDQLIAKVLHATGLPADRLELEITETAIIEDKAVALDMLRRIKALGVTIAIDDFGTGHSSLGTLHAFPIDKIKIDRSFLLDAINNAQAQAIIRTVVALGQSLDIPILAEGVETADQAEMLQQLGCSQVQGYYFGRPGPPPPPGTRLPTIVGRSRPVTMLDVA